MGNLVTLTIHNDNLHQIEKNAERFVKELVAVASGETTSTTIFGQTKVQGYKHISAPVIYVQMGGTCHIMDPYDPETRDLMRNRPDFFREMLEYMESTSSKLRELYQKEKRDIKT